MLNGRKTMEVGPARRKERRVLAWKVERNLMDSGIKCEVALGGGFFNRIRVMPTRARLSEL
jgi:hypothetical protein